MNPFTFIVVVITMDNNLDLHLSNLTPFSCRMPLMHLMECKVKPKDKDPIDKKSGAIYLYQCGELMCDEEYIGETSRTLGERYKEPEGTLSHPCTQHPNWSQYHT